MKNEEVGDFRAPALLLAAVCGLGCALSRGQPMPDVLAPVVIPSSLDGLQVRIVAGATDLDQELAAAFETELARAGLVVLTDPSLPADVEMRVGLDLRSAGLVVEGVGTVSVEREGTLIDRFFTPVDVYRRDRFAAAVARQLMEALARSRQVDAFARVQRGLEPPPPAAPTAAAAPSAAEAAPSAVAAPPARFVLSRVD